MDTLVEVLVHVDVHLNAHGSSDCSNHDDMLTVVLEQVVVLEGTKMTVKTRANLKVNGSTNPMTLNCDIPVRTSMRFGGGGGGGGGGEGLANSTSVSKTTLALSPSVTITMLSLSYLQVAMIHCISDKYLGVKLKGNQKAVKSSKNQTRLQKQPGLTFNSWVIPSSGSIRSVYFTRDTFPVSKISTVSLLMELPVTP